MVLHSSDDELDANTKAVGRLEQLMGEIGPKTTNFQVLIPDSASQHFILGPALKSGSSVPDTYSSDFPRRKSEEFLINSQGAKFYEWFHDHHRYWPTNDPNWVSWFRRVEDQKRYVWHQAGIYDILQFSKLTIPFNSSLVLAALCFWSTSTNCFHLAPGPLTITLLDLSALLGLRPDGPQFDALVANSISIPDDNFGIEFTKLANFSSFIIEHNKTEGVVTDEEHVAFLHYWLCCYLLCSRSVQIVKANLPLAVALSKGEPYALGPLVLAYLYRGINDFLHSQLSTAGGPLWILQLWLHAYFPKVRPNCFSLPNLSCEGLKYVFFEEPEISFHDCLMHMCHLDREENFNFIPYSKSDALPVWLIFPRSEMTNTELSTLVDIWASFLVSRDLPVGVILEKYTSKTCGVEAYCPNLCARQFGLIQEIPTPPFFSFNTHFPERTMFNSLEQFRVLMVTTSHLFKKLKFVLFSLRPSATSSFKCWWKKYYKEAFPHDQDLNYIFEIGDLDHKRPSPPPQSSDALKKRKESAVEIKGARSDQLQAYPSTKRIKYVTAQQAKSSSVADGKEANSLPKIQCLNGPGRAHSKKRKVQTARHVLRSMIKGNYLSHAKLKGTILEKMISSVSKDERTNVPPKSRSLSGRGKVCGKRRITKDEVRHVLINLTKSSSQSHSESKEATFEEKTGPPRSKQRKPDARDEGDIVDLTEDNTNVKLENLPPTQAVAVDASNENLPSRISSSPNQVDGLQLPQESSIQSPPQARPYPPNPSRKDRGSCHSSIWAKSNLTVSKSKPSIQALNFLESYLLQHPNACIMTNKEKISNSDLYEISKAKAKIQSLSTLSLDEVMEIECLQNLKSALEVLLKTDDQTGVQHANVESVKEKLAFVESKYGLASGIAAEVEEEDTRKKELEKRLQVCALRYSDAQNKEVNLLTCITVQKSTVEDLVKKLAVEKAVLEKLVQLHASQKTEAAELSYTLDRIQQMLHDCSIHEKTWVKKALQAKKDLKLVEATWVQIQQLVSLISDQQQKETTPCHV